MKYGKVIFIHFLMFSHVQTDSCKEIPSHRGAQLLQKNKANLASATLLTCVLISIIQYISIFVEIWNLVRFVMWTLVSRDCALETKVHMTNLTRSSFETESFRVPIERKLP